MPSSFSGDAIPARPEAQLADWMRDVMRRLTALESSPALPRTSMRKGTTRFLADDGVQELAVFGDFGAPGIPVFKGFFMRDLDQVTVIATRSDQKGIVKPIFQGPFFSLASASEPVTSGTFVPVAFYTPMEIYHEVLRVLVPVVIPASTTGEMKLVETFSGRATDVVTLPANSSGRARFEWVHQVPKGDIGRYSSAFQVQARRTSGAGTISVFQPDDVAWACQFDIAAANTNGNVAFT